MNKVLYFNICAIPIYIIIIITTIYRRMTVGRSNRLYLGVAVCAFTACLAACMSEIVEKTGFATMPPDESTIFWIKFAEYIYFAARNATSLVYLLFVISMTKSWYKINHPIKKLIIYAPYIVILVMLVLNEKTDWVFLVTPDKGYHRGTQILILYIMSFSYMVFGTFHLLIHRKSLDRIEWISLMSMYFINLISVIFQYFYPMLVIESFTTSITVLFVVIYVQRPETQVDMTTGLPCYRVFCNEMNKISISGQSTQLMMISMLNAAEMSKFLKDKYLTYLHIIDGTIRVYAKKEKVVCEVYFEQPGSFYIIMENTDYNPVQVIPEIRERIRNSAAEVLDTGVSPDTRIVTVNFPEDISTPDELFRFGHNFPRFADYSRVFSRAPAITGKRSYQIEAHLDDILNRAVAAGGLKVRYQPLWSVETESFTSAEAVIALSDEVYGDIDSELLISAAEERGLIVRLGSRILEEVFAFAGSESRRRLGFKHICIGLSVTQCMQPDLTDLIWGLHEKYRVSPANIAFEIKESSYENVSVIFSENIAKLSAQGYAVVLDGFGHGYMNMQDILNMPIKAVRIDKSVVRAGRSGGGRAVLKGLIDMLGSIPLDVIAEGADDSETAEMLRELGCLFIQGEYYAPPTDREELSRFTAPKA